jgi:P4 family phage/plasmid primase-like protien
MRKVGDDSHTAIEVYDRGRFFILTGDVLMRPSGEIPDRQEAIDEMYQWVKEKRTERIELDPVEPIAPRSTSPDRWSAEARASAYLLKVDPAVSGDAGHNRTLRAACAIGPGFDLDPGTAYQLLAAEWNPRCVPPWSEKELRRKVEEAYRLEDRRGWLLNEDRGGRMVATAAVSRVQVLEGEDVDARLATVARTDLGNAIRMATRFRGDMRFCKAWGEWLVWDGARYAPDQTGAAMRLAKETARRILAEAATIVDGDERKAHTAWAMASQSRAKLESMLSLAASEPGVPIGVEEMNRDGQLLNCLNGTIDLRTGELRAHRRDDLITQLCPVEFDPDAECPLWDSTLGLFFSGDARLVAYWQRICGYALVGEVRDHVLIIAYGEGSNGKSTILGTLLHVLGRDYAIKAPPNLLMAKSHDPHPVDRADLFGRRLVVAIETGDGRRLDEQGVKELTGGDSIRARRMRENPWEFDPSHTIVMATNHKPVVRGSDNGIWRRMRLVPFLVTVDGATADTEIPSKLKAEAAGILAWCVRGCVAWQQIGLSEPESVAEATAEYRAEQDIIGAFLDERAVLNPSMRTRCGEVYSAYQSWADGAGERPMTLQAFGSAMRRRGVETRTSNGKWYVGVGIRQPDDQSEHWNN